MGVRSPILTDEAVVASAWRTSWAELNERLNMKDLEFEPTTDEQFHFDSYSLCFLLFCRRRNVYRNKSTLMGSGLEGVGVIVLR